MYRESSEMKNLELELIFVYNADCGLFNLKTVYTNLCHLALINIIYVSLHSVK